LAELELESIPRLLVFNKVDLVSPPEAEALRRKHEGALFISATNRETTRALLGRIADLLAERWAGSVETFRQPEATLEAEKGAEPAEADAAADGQSLTTLEELLGKTRRSRHRTQAPV